MNSFLLAALFGSLVIQLVSSQGSRTTWAANQSPGLEGVPVSLLAVPGNAPGLRIMYNALKADKRILELLKAGILSPLSNSIVLMPSSKTKVQTTKTTVVETMTSESGLQEDRTTTIVDSTVQQNALPDSNHLPEHNSQGPGLNMDLLNERLQRLNIIPNAQIDMIPNTNLLMNDNTPTDFLLNNNGQSGQIPQLNLDIIKQRLQAMNLLRSELPQFQPTREPVPAPPSPKATYRPDPEPIQNSADAPLINTSVEKLDQMTPSSGQINSVDTAVKAVVEPPAVIPQNVNVGLEYDSKALTDTLLVMLKTMYMIQTYIKDSLATTTPSPMTTTVETTTSRPTTTTPRPTTTSPRPTTTSPSPTTTTPRPTTTTHRPTTTLPKTTTTLLPTYPTTVPATTTEAMTTIDYYGTDPTTEMETTTEVYEMVTSGNPTLYTNSTWNPEILDLILSFKAAITIVNKGEPAATVQSVIKPAVATTIPKKQQETVNPLAVLNVATPKRLVRPTKAVLAIPSLTSKQEPTASMSVEASLNIRRAGTNVPEVAMRSSKIKSAAPSEGRMTPPPLDFNEYQVNMAIAHVNAAKTENQAAYAAAAVYSPILDMSDAVQSALETKVQHLRTPANWQHHIPPPLPFNFDPMHLVFGAFYKTLDRNAPQTKFGTSGPPPVAGPPMGAGMGTGMGTGPGPMPAAMGPPTSIRRGGRPGTPGNARRNRNFGSARWQTRGEGQGGLGQNALNSAGTSGSWGNRNNAGSQGETGMAGISNASPSVQDFPAPASVTPGWTNPAINANSNPTWWTK